MRYRLLGTCVCFLWILVAAGFGAAAEAPGDTCADAVPVPVPSTTTGSTVEATADPGASFCVTSVVAPGVWYDVVGTGTMLTASVCNAADYDTRMNVYCQDCGVPTCIAGNDDDLGGGCGVTSQVAWCSQIGSTYHILVHGASGATGTFDLTLDDTGELCEAPVDCVIPDPAGACVDGVDCEVVTETECTDMGGVYQGDGSKCLTQVALQGPATGADVGTTGDPVYLFSGELYQSVVDLRIRGRGPDFAWARKYRSRLGPNVGLGNGWDFSYNIEIFEAGDPPGEVENLRFTAVDSMSWDPPAYTAGPAAGLRYCTLRSTDPADFASAPTTTIIETDGADQTSPEPVVPSPGELFSYLIVAKNGQQAGDLGTNSAGVTRPGLPCGISGPDLLLADGNTRRDVYELHPDGTWVAREFFRIFTRNLDGSYTLTFPDTATWEFRPIDGTSAEGKIDRIRDHNGNALSFDYDAAGRLITVTDTLGRQIDVAHNAQGFIEHVTDFTGRQVRYEYYDGVQPGGSFGDLESVTTPVVTGTPNGNDFPAGKTMVYTYSTGFLDNRLNHNLLTITDGKSQTYLVNEYDPSTDPADINFDRIRSQTWGDPGDRIDFVYIPQIPAAGNGFAVCKAFVNDAVGNVKELYFDDRNRTTIVREHTGRADPDLPTNLDLGTNVPVNPLRPTDPPLFETRYEWNDDALPTRIVHPSQNETLNSYDPSNPSRRSQGNRLQSCRLPGPLGGDQPQICESFEYAPAINHDTNRRTRRVDGRGNELLYEYDSSGNRTRVRERIPSVITEFEYNAFGQMTANVWPDNGSNHRRRDEFTYHASGPQTGYLDRIIVDAPNLALTTAFEYDAVGNIVREIDPRGHDTQRDYNQLDQIVRETSREVVDGSGERYRIDTFYDANDNVIRIDRENFDEQGTPRFNSHLSTLFAYDVLDHLTRVCEEVGSVNLPNGILDCTTINPVDLDEFIVIEYEYDANRNRTLQRSGESTNGNQPMNLVRTLYDERDLVFQKIRADGDPGQSTMQFDYDDNGNRTREIRGLEGTPQIHEFVYDGYDRPSLDTDSMGNISTSHYDAGDNRVSSRLDGELIDVPGSAANVRLTEAAHVHDPMNRLTRAEIQYFDPVTQTPGPGGQQLGKVITQIEYSDSSQVTRIIDDNLHDRVTVYDTANREGVAIDAAGNTVTYAYDANSNVTGVTELEKSDLGNPDLTYVTSYEFDNLDRLVVKTDAIGNRKDYAYDSPGNHVQTVDALGVETRHQYDGLNRRTTTIRDMNGSGASLLDPADIVTREAWDDSWRTTGLIDDRGNQTTYEYDSLNRKTRTTYADGTQHTSIYDVHDNEVARTDANGSAITRTYDAADRQVGVTVVPGAGVSNETTFESYSYDGMNRMIRAEDDDSVLLYTYDSLSRATSETVLGQTTSGVYDGVGNRMSCTYPGGRVITATYDALDRLKSVSDVDGVIADYDYLGPGRVERREYRNGTRTEYEYDGVVPNAPGDFGRRQLVRTLHTVVATGDVIDERTYTWDRMQNKTQRKDVRAGGPQLIHDYAYDDAFRLIGTTVTDSVPTIVRQTDYAFDGTGNRTSVTGGPDPGTYDSTATLPAPADFQVNQYTDTPFDTRTYDANGNLMGMANTAGDIVTIQYNFRNQMVEYLDSAVGQRHVYTYDPTGRRITRVLDADGAAVETRYFRDGLHVVEEQDGAGVTTQSYAFGQFTDEILNMFRAGDHWYYHADDLFNIMALTDSAGNVVERYDYQDYGVPEFRDVTGNTVLPISESAVGNPFPFNTRRYDPENGWYCHRTRYRDPRVGDWTTRDVIGIWGDPINVGNATTYVGNNPFTHIDPWGLQKGKPGATEGDVIKELDGLAKKLEEEKRKAEEIRDQDDTDWDELTRVKKKIKKLEDQIDKHAGFQKLGKDAKTRVNEALSDKAAKRKEAQDAADIKNLGKEADKAYEDLKAEIEKFADPRHRDDTLAEKAIKNPMEAYEKDKKRRDKNDPPSKQKAREIKQKLEAAMRHLEEQNDHKKARRKREPGDRVVTPSGDDEPDPKKSQKDK